MRDKVKAECLCCSGRVIIENKPAKWYSEKDKVKITHVKWQENYR